MPTVGWIQETAIDLYWERGLDNLESVKRTPPNFKCRHCNKIFKSKDARDWHEIEHPIANPILLIKGNEVSNSTYKLTQKITPEDIECAFVNYFVINGIEVNDINNVRQLLCQSQQQFFQIELCGKEISKTIKIDIQIPDQNKLIEVDKEFKRHFSSDNYKNTTITSFSESTEHLVGCEWYRDGLVKYIQGIMAKDQRTETIKFEDFSNRLNQSFSLLSVYNTPLAISICQLIKFIMNDFRTPVQACYVPTLATGILFFNRSDKVISKSKDIREVRLPTDYATYLILNQIIEPYKTTSLTDILSQISTIKRAYLSLQDKQKLDYICYRKSEDEQNTKQMRYFVRRIKNVNEFSQQFETDKEFTHG